MKQYQDFGIKFEGAEYRAVRPECRVWGPGCKIPSLENVADNGVVVIFITIIIVPVIIPFIIAIIQVPSNQSSMLTKICLKRKNNAFLGSTSPQTNSSG